MPQEAHREPPALARRAAAEALGTALLLAVVVGSGIMGERLAGGNVAIALLANTLSTGAGLVSLILTFGPVSGGHFNPAASTHAREGMSQLVSGFVATFGLLATIWGTSRSRASVTPFAVGAYITSAYWFTSSTSFANPAVTLARAATDTFAGIRPGNAPGFIVAQLLGAGAATLAFAWLVPRSAGARDTTPR
ncbi:MAG: aquaporin [Deltaproteobacteria bacterium]|nr:aquaporin [Deltaproteobacteria bacterium]